MVYLPTFTIEINHSCSNINIPYMDPLGYNMQLQSRHNLDGVEGRMGHTKSNIQVYRVILLMTWNVNNCFHTTGTKYLFCWNKP